MFLYRFVTTPNNKQSPSPQSLRFWTKNNKLLLHRLTGNQGFPPLGGGGEGVNGREKKNDGAIHISVHQFCPKWQPVKERQNWWINGYWQPFSDRGDLDTSSWCYFYFFINNLKMWYDSIGDFSWDVSYPPNSDIRTNGDICWCTNHPFGHINMPGSSFI